MPLFAVLLFALLPLMALVIHAGFVTLTRRQMQTAVHTAAIEGLRFRDDASLSEPERRGQVRDLVAAVFDDNLNSDGTDAMQFGAGPTLDINSGVELGDSDFRALTTVSVPSERAFKPELQLNETDQVHGDMVRGSSVFDPIDPDHDSHEESPDYSREDFESQPGGDAFLVRLRRTRSPDGTAPPMDAVPGVSSTGPTVPVLFGRGPYGGTEFLNRRERGTIVRATAIAQARPVITVEVPAPSDGLDEGLALFDIQRSSWDSLTSTSVTFATNGAFDSGVSGRLIVRQVLTLGEETDALGSTRADGELELDADRIVPIVDSINGTDRVIAFGLIRLTGSGGSYTLSRLPEAVVPRNASAQFLIPVSVSGADFEDVWAAFQAVSGFGVALAPGLVRAIE
ncbi:MAG: hypothetical protein R3B90_13795 [Planctomycetaceae bacterium]